METRRVDIATLVGKTLEDVTQVGKEEIRMTDSEGNAYRLYHDQDCCEGVYIEDVVGDLSDLVGSPITMAEETSKSGTKEYGDSETWTFYRFATVKGYVTIRWYGSSNGYYSESVDFAQVIE